PDATISFENPAIEGNSRSLSLNYTVDNVNSTDIVPAGSPVSIFANNIYMTTFVTQNPLNIDESVSGTILIAIPETVANDFELKFIVDQGENGFGIQKELNENNNSFSASISLQFFPAFNVLENLNSCNLGLEKGIFDLQSIENDIKINAQDVVA